MRYLIGYGYGWRFFYAAGWMFGITCLGTLLLRCAGERDKGFWYSLDMILPLVRLDERHYNGELPSRRLTWYFYGHQLVGYFLILIVIAGLSGLME